MYNQSKFLQLKTFFAFATILTLASCGSKPEEPAASPTTSPSAMASPTPAASKSPTASPTAVKASPAATTSPQPKATLSAEALKLGVKPKDATTCPAQEPIKGNMTKKRGNIYHTTKSPDYKTVKPEICFKDTATAEKAGFRLPK